MEFTAVPIPGRDSDLGLKVDRKITMLLVLLSERFGQDGARAYRDWLSMAVQAQRQAEPVGMILRDEVRDGRE